MSEHPDWATKYKRKGSELRCIRGRYYLYEVKCIKDEKLKKWKKVTLKQIGVITEEDGLIPTGMKRKGRIPKGKSAYKEGSCPPLESNFLEDFSQLSDPRSERNQMYHMDELLFVTLCAVICGAEGWQDIEDFGHSKLDYLRQYMDYANGIPSDDTLRRFYRKIDPGEFERLFRNWIGGIAKQADSQVIAIDGKSSRHSFDGDDGKMLHVISAFATDVRIVLGQEKVSEKSNEITAIPKMLEWLDVKGHIVTIDAMGCQYAIANRILAKQGDYIFSLKGNHGTLLEDVADYFEDHDLMKEVVSSINYDKGHGRIETRECWVVTDTEWLHKIQPKWTSIQSIIKIRSRRELKKKTTEEVRYYISSLKHSPEKMLKNIRSHWLIENALHWVLDMSFNQDYSRIRKDNAPYAMAIINHIAINLLQLAKPKRQSIKRMRKICGWDTNTLDDVIRQKIS